MQIQSLVSLESNLQFMHNLLEKNVELLRARKVLMPSWFCNITRTSAQQT